MDPVSRPHINVGLNLVVGKVIKHLAEDLYVLTVDLLEHVIDAHRDDRALDLVVLVQLHDQVHIPEHLFAHAVLDFGFVEDVHHLLVELVLRDYIVVDVAFGSVGRCAPTFPVLLLDFEHLVELLLAPGQEQLPEVHLHVLLIIELLE